MVTTNPPVTHIQVRVFVAFYRLRNYPAWDVTVAFIQHDPTSPGILFRRIVPWDNILRVLIMRVHFPYRTHTTKKI